MEIQLIKRGILKYLLENGNNEIVSLLLQHKADVSLISSRSWLNAFLLCCIQGDVSVFETLFTEMNSKILNSRCKRGYSGLMYAIHNKHYSLAEKLIKIGINVDITNKKNQNALSMAIDNGDSRIVGLLLKSKVIVNEDLIDLSVSKEKYEIVSLLTQYFGSNKRINEFKRKNNIVVKKPKVAKFVE